MIWRQKMGSSKICFLDFRKSGIILWKSSRKQKYFGVLIWGLGRYHYWFLQKTRHQKSQASVPSAQLKDCNPHGDCELCNMPLMFNFGSDMSHTDLARNNASGRVTRLFLLGMFQNMETFKTHFSAFLQKFQILPKIWNHCIKSIQRYQFWGKPYFENLMHQSP